MNGMDVCDHCKAGVVDGRSLGPILSLFTGFVHLFKRAVTEVVGVSMSGFLTLAVVLGGFCAMNRKTLMITQHIFSTAFKNSPNKSLNCLIIRVLAFSPSHAPNYPPTMIACVELFACTYLATLLEYYSLYQNCF